MGLLNSSVYEARVSLYGVSAYARSGLADHPIRAKVDLVNRRTVDYPGRDPAALLLPLAAARLVSLARRAPALVSPIMEILEFSADQLLQGESKARSFRLRELGVETDPAKLASLVQEIGPGFQASAQVNSGLPVVEDNPGGPPERRTTLVLMERRGDKPPWARFKIPRDSANPLVTSAAFFATLERCARGESFERVTLPAAAGLAALGKQWSAWGSPAGISVEESAQADAAVLGVVMADDPLASVIAFDPSDTA